MSLSDLKKEYQAELDHLQNLVNNPRYGELNLPLIRKHVDDMAPIKQKIEVLEETFNVK